VLFVLFNFVNYEKKIGAWGSVVVKELRYWSGSIPGCVTGIFSDIFPSDITLALGSTQPLMKMSIRNVTGGKGGRCVRLTTSSPLRAECHEIWEPKPPGTLWATPDLLRDSTKCQNPTVPGASLRGGNFDAAKISLQRINRMPSRVTRRYVD
jgi:hypothetical protein